MRCFYFSLPRSCGQLFCSECSEQAVPIPAEQLYQPVRVCDQCFAHLTSSQPVIASCDNNDGPAAAAREETAVDAATLDKKDKIDTEEKPVEKELEERLIIGTPDLQSTQLEIKDCKPESVNCNAEVEINKTNSGVEVEVN